MVVEAVTSDDNVNLRISNIDAERIRDAENKFGVFSGPYNSFSSLKDVYLKLYELGFEDLNIVKKNK